MDPNASQNQKQQLVETLRQATNIVITTAKNPDIDQAAAAIALYQILSKMDKNPEVAVSSKLPSNLSFLPTDMVHPQFQGHRDFVIELDISKTEADKLKYIPENNKLKIYITPYNGNFTKDDVGFSYGEYHCDAIIVLGATSRDTLDPALLEDKKATEKSQLLTIASTSPNPNNQLNGWYDPAASSVCEMLMSLSEALQSGLLDNNIATALLSGIMAKTEHFTASNTTPKVMTMAAQLLAAGARQAEVIKNLAPQPPPAPPKPAGPTIASGPPPASAPIPPKPAAPPEDSGNGPGKEISLRKARNQGPPPVAPSVAPPVTAAAPAPVTPPPSSSNTPPTTSQVPMPNTPAPVNPPVPSPAAAPSSSNQPAVPILPAQPPVQKDRVESIDVPAPPKSFPHENRTVQPLMPSVAPTEQIAPVNGPAMNPIQPGSIPANPNTVPLPPPPAPLSATAPPPPAVAPPAPLGSTNPPAPATSQPGVVLDVEAARKAVEAAQQTAQHPEDAQANFANPPVPGGSNQNQNFPDSLNIPRQRVS